VEVTYGRRQDDWQGIKHGSLWREYIALDAWLALWALIRAKGVRDGF
jgi:hypothetical protein